MGTMAVVDSNSDTGEDSKAEGDSEDFVIGCL